MKVPLTGPWATTCFRRWHRITCMSAMLAVRRGRARTVSSPQCSSNCVLCPYLWLCRCDGACSRCAFKFASSFRKVAVQGPVSSLGQTHHLGASWVLASILLAMDVQRWTELSASFLRIEEL